MSGESDFDALLDRFHSLGRRDRNAILAKLSPADRAQVEAAIIASNDARTREQTRRRRAGRQFSGYSPWLSDIVQQACRSDGPQPEAISGTARRALADAHRAMHVEGEDKAQGSFGQIRVWFEDIMSPAGTRRS